MRNTILAPILLAALLLGLSSSAAAFNIDRFIMPGPLSRLHAKYENDCEKCHDSLDKKKPRKNCLACHEEIEKDISNHTGFHGKKKAASQQKCLHCHTEHKGRDADIILMDLDNFDHLDTDFSLKGLHLKIQCGLCHPANSKFRETKSECFSCHKLKDPHLGALGENCQTCHQEGGWKKYSFDHTKTKFQLKGVHQDLPCLRCHHDQKWKELPLQCTACHKVNDIHGNRFGDACEKCHSTDKPLKAPSNSSVVKSGWTNTRFDHEKTKFKLLGKHLKVGCMQCHAEIEPGVDTTKDKKKTACFGCHQKNDVHKTRFGNECDKCHLSDAWNNTVFKHDTTKYPLVENHQKVSCIKCHTGTIYEQKLDLTCIGCHRLDDKHAGSFGNKCETCHTVTKWKNNTFDHKKTKYQLTGRHILVPCSKCHYGIPAGVNLETSCNTCHRNNDVHKGQQGQKCEKCHNAAGWFEKIFFDHDLTKFPLLGLHGVSPCEACHPSNTFKDTSTICNDCHLEKDTHKTAFGTECYRCHTPNGWKIWSFDHATKTKFTLTGAHVGLVCSACHKQSITTKNSTPKKCEACHLRDDAHRGKYGKFCDRCHSTDSFKTLQLGN